MPNYRVTRVDDDGATREVAAGSARTCLAALAWGCESGDLHDLRLDVLPHIQRRIAKVERNLGLGALAVDPGEDAEVYPAARPLFAAATRAAETYQPRAG